MRQRWNECALATACAVAGQDYTTASDLFQAIHGCEWWPREMDQHKAATWARETWLPFVRQYICRGYPGYGMFDDYESSSASHTPNEHTRFIVVRCLETRHVMAYADGIIEDSGFDVVDLAENVLAKYYSDWQIEAYLGFEGR